LQIAKLNEILAGRRLHVRMTDGARRWLIEKTCTDRSYGARPLKRALQKHVEDELSEALIQGSVTEESEIEVSCEEGKLVFRTLAAEEVAAELIQKV